MVTHSFSLVPTGYGLEAAGVKVDFHYINGPIETGPATGIAEMYEGPYYKFHDADVNVAAVLARDVESKSDSAEDWCRAWHSMGPVVMSAAEARKFLENELQKHPPGFFDGVLGFSEGASLAAGFMMSESYKKDAAGALRFAIFICALPPCIGEKGGLLLADEVDDRIDIPTAHIFGSKDPVYKGSLALYNLCNKAKASAFKHEAGHTIPWSPAATEGIVTAITAAIKECETKAPRGIIQA